MLGNARKQQKAEQFFEIEDIKWLFMSIILHVKNVALIPTVLSNTGTHTSACKELKHQLITSIA